MPYYGDIRTKGFFFDHREYINNQILVEKGVTKNLSHIEITITKYKKGVKKISFMFFFFLKNLSPFPEKQDQFFALNFANA